MALITTTGHISADSYVTTTEALEYIDNRKPWIIDSWSALTEAQMEWQLRLGARIVDTFDFRGLNATNKQARCFPRVFPGEYFWPMSAGEHIGNIYVPPYDDMSALTSAYTEADDDTIIMPGIPDEVKWAQVEVTYQVVHKHLSTLNPLQAGAVSVNSIGIGGKLSIGLSDSSVASQLLSKDRFGATSVIEFYLRRYISGGFRFATL